MPKSRRRTTKKTTHVAAFHQKVLQHSPRHVIDRQLRQTMPWLDDIADASVRGDALDELAELTIAAAGGSPRAALALQSATARWQSYTQQRPGG